MPLLINSGNENSWIFPVNQWKEESLGVVDADDFIQEMVDASKSIAKELGKLDDLSKKEADELYEIVALGS